MKFKFSATLASIVVLLVVFQNCSGTPFSGMRSYPSNAVQADNPLPFDHPTTEISNQGDPVSGKLVMGDRLYLESAFRDIFIPPDSPTNVVNYVEAVLFQEFAPIQSALGRACDINQDGTSDDCLGSTANVDIKMSAGTLPIREAARIQVCRRILGNNTMVELMINQVKGNQPTPNDVSVAALINLFFPAQNAPLSLNAKLIELDQFMATSGESVKDRWAILFLTVCESPAWQVL